MVLLLWRSFTPNQINIIFSDNRIQHGRSTEQEMSRTALRNLIRQRFCKLVVMVTRAYRAKTKRLLQATLLLDKWSGSVAGSAAAAPDATSWPGLLGEESKCKYCCSLKAGLVFAVPAVQWCNLFHVCGRGRAKLHESFPFIEKMLHLVDDIFWQLGFRSAEHAEKLTNPGQIIAYCDYCNECGYFDYFSLELTITSLRAHGWKNAKT